jgi:lysyl-tRNA synthetase class 1
MLAMWLARKHTRAALSETMVPGFQLIDRTRIMALPARIELDPEMLAAAAESKAWPFEEAGKIVARYAKTGYPETVLFETGYGPSGLPHIGTFGEVARTTMVRHAFRVLTRDAVKTRLLCFSDDMDGMRKIPDKSFGT